GAAVQAQLLVGAQRRAAARARHRLGGGRRRGGGGLGDRLLDRRGRLGRRLHL
ncbi:MAG: hypothetical protein AVDCRST_MAG30-280, partial [uncultured Solirubrobacteraceae bacterium]